MELSEVSLYKIWRILSIDIGLDRPRPPNDILQTKPETLVDVAKELKSQKPYCVFPQFL